MRLVPGAGEFDINGRSLEEYFPTRVHRMVAVSPLRVSGREKDYDVIATIRGGGVSGQAGAIRTGIARALIELDPELRGQMKAEGYLTRDAREGTSQVRAQEGPQGAPVLEALILRALRDSPGADARTESAMPHEIAPGVLSWASELDRPALEQAERTARLPIVASHVALMPDAHLGMGATIGSVIATETAVIPSAVGVDIGCGMAARRLDLRVDQLPDQGLDGWVDRMRRSVPRDSDTGTASRP